MAHTGAGRGEVNFDDPFFQWLRDQLLMVEEYAYAGTDFSGDLDLLLPPSGKWGDISKKQKTLKWQLCFFILMFYIFYV